MSQDNHRTPGRLASPFSEPNRRPSRRSKHRQPKPPPDDIIDAQEDDYEYHPPQTSRRATRPYSNGHDEDYYRDPDTSYTNGHDPGYHQDADVPYINGRDHSPRPSYVADDSAAEPAEPGLPSRESIPQWDRPAPPPGELSKKERHQLLMHTIQLYDEEWRLGGIRADEKRNWLIAYLLPRNKRLDLKSALSRGQVLKITIDGRGNTDIQEPKKRGAWRKITSWFS